MLGQVTTDVYEGIQSIVSKTFIDIGFAIRGDLTGYQHIITIIRVVNPKEAS